MNRRSFLRSATALTSGLAVPGARHLFADDANLEGWRTFEVRTRVEVLKPQETTRVWLPAALIPETPFQKTLSNQFRADSGTAKMIKSRADGLGIVAAVLGVVITMGALGGPPEEMGKKVAAALVGTFLGILMCYGVFGPLAGRMARKLYADPSSPLAGMI